MTDRIAQIKKRLDNNDERAMFYERMELLEEAKEQYGECDRGELYAHAMAYVLEHMSTDIYPFEQLAGTMKQTVPNEAQEKRFEELSRDNNFKSTNYFSEDPLKICYFDDPDDRYCPEWFTSIGHFIPAYDRILRIGFEGIIEEAREKLDKEPLSSKKTSFLNNCITVSEAVVRMAERYRQTALELAECAHHEDRLRLLKMAEVLENAPKKPAASFREALQTVWFVHMLLSGVIGARDYSFGRLDQILYPYYRADIEAGRMDRKDARELIEEFYIRINELIGHSWESYQSKRILCVNSIEYIVLGGTDEKGADASNEVSWLMLEAMEELQVKQPALIVRWHPDIDDRFMEYAVKVSSNGGGYPSFFDERKVISSLVACGRPLEDAKKFAFYGCNNNCIPGNEDELYELWHSVPKYLELALNEGVSMLNGQQCGVKTMPASEMQSLEDIMSALRQQMRFALDKGRKNLWDFNQLWIAMRPFSFESVLAEHCIERAETINEGGTDYKHFTNHFVGIATVANSLAAIEYMVFRKKLLSMEELVETLKTNWAGKEELRARVQNKVPKYGNDIDEVDSIARAVTDMFAEEVLATAPMPNGRVPYPAFYSLWRHRDLGVEVAATPDGRLAHEPLSESLSGTYGTEKCGPTAALNSAARLALDKTPSGGNNVKLQPVMFRGEAGQKRLKSLISTYFEEGGSQLQLNIVDTETLKDAKLHPEKHRDLLVRVVGYSAYFVTLSPEQQDEIIQRNVL